MSDPDKTIGIKIMPPLDPLVTDRPGLNKTTENSIDIQDPRLRPQEADPINSPNQRLRPAPIVKLEPQVKQELLNDIEELIGGNIFDDDDRKKLRDELGDTLNKVIDIPLIGERIEGFIIKKLLLVAELIGKKYLKKHVDAILEKL